MTDPRLDVLLNGLEQAFERRAWHGTTLLGAIHTLSPQDVAWRPAPERHSIHELVVHAAYWKYRVWRHLTDDSESRFEEAGADWFARHEEDAARWGDDVGRLKAWHARVVAAARLFDPARLGEEAYDGYTYEDLLRGIAAHDLYHAGQIALLKRLYPDLA